MNTVYSWVRLIRTSAIFLLLGVAAIAARAQGEITFTNIFPAISFGSHWRYWNHESPPDPLWKTSEFDDFPWPVGRAQLGYGDGDEATVTRSNSAPHTITAYFRNAFVLPQNVSSAEAQFRTIIDDGAVIYINGIEVARANMPPGPVTHETLAEGPVGEPENDPRLMSTVVHQLRAGTNIIAVEVHQANAMSTDMSFDLELKLTPLIDESDFATIRILATQPHTSEPLPNALVAPGEFTVFRADPHLDQSLIVGLSYSGTASSQDYETLPIVALFPAGSNSVKIPVLPKADDLVEGIETVVASIVLRSNIWDRNSPLRPYRLHVSNSVDRVFIHDATNFNAVPMVSLSTSTNKGINESGESNFPRFRLRRSAPRDMELVVYLSYSGTATMGQDVQTMAQAVRFAPGAWETNVHVVPINDAEVEPTETVVARLEAGPGYVLDPGEQVQTISVFDDDSGPMGTIVITQPQDGAIFTQGQIVPISTVTLDNFGTIRKVEFFAGTNRIGVSDAGFPKPAGVLVTNRIFWTNPPAGPHTLTARATDSDLNAIVSEPVHITVEPGSAPVVGVVFQQKTEPWPNADFAPGLFRFFRTGSTNDALMVFFEKGGAAIPGVDYIELPNYVVFRPGQSVAGLDVVAIDDSLPETNETVVVTLRPPPPGVDTQYPAFYVINPTNRSARLEIFDNDRRTNATAHIQITAPQSGQTFSQGEPIVIDALAVDPSGYIGRVEFYSASNLVGVSEVNFIVPPAPGTPIAHSTVWSNAPAGNHVLTARARDSAGNTVISQQVPISVVLNPDRVTLAVEVIDDVGTERTSSGPFDNAIFRIRRVSGPTNVPVSMWLTFSGTAEPFADYPPYDTMLLLPQGKGSTNLVITPFADDLVEGDETVVLTLNALNCGPGSGSIIPLPSCYQIFGTNRVQAIIRDANVASNQPPRVVIDRPHDGAVFEAGQRIHIAARATDPNGVNYISILLDGRSITATNGNWLGFSTNLPAGQHTLTALAQDPRGGRGFSDPVRILVRGTNDNTFVHRELPPGYMAGISFNVRLIARPPAGAQAWGVEEQVPHGWHVGNISHNGVLDVVNGKVKFGHFTDPGPRILTYQLTAPHGSTEAGEFEGSSSIDGLTFPIGGQRIIRPLLSEFHPADLNRDSRMILAEVTGYAAAWKRGSNWVVQPNPIPASYVTRAGMIWRQGEVYRFAPTNTPPVCWVPNTIVFRSVSAEQPSTATRIIGEPDDNGGRLVTIAVQPAVGVSSYTVEENLPAGWTVADVSDDGAFDEANGAVRWGVFLDGSERTLSYKLIRPASLAGATHLLGKVAVDGNLIFVEGDSSIQAVSGANPLQLATAAQVGGGVTLKLTGPAGQVCILEASTDLATWTQVSELFLPDGNLSYVHQESGENSHRYFRLRSK